MQVVDKCYVYRIFRLGKQRRRRCYNNCCSDDHCHCRSFDSSYQTHVPILRLLLSDTCLIISIFDWVIMIKNKESST